MSHHFDTHDGHTQSTPIHHHTLPDPIHKPTQTLETTMTPAPASQPQPVPSIGRVVHYVLDSGRSKGEHRPAMIVRVWGNTPTSLVQLQVFTDATNDFDHGQKGADGMMWRTSVAHSDEGKFGTYHWPEVIPTKA